MLVGSFIFGALLAACPDSFWIWPENGRLPPNGKFLLEGRGEHAKLVATLEKYDPVFISQKHRVRLRVTSVHVGERDAAQAWLEPTEPLIPGRAYLLEVEGVPRQALLAGFTIEAQPDRHAPVFLEPPALTDDLIDLAIYDEGPVLLRVDVSRTRTRDLRTVFHYPLAPSEMVAIGANPCGGGGILFAPVEPAVLMLSAIDAAGRVVAAPGRGLLRGAGGGSQLDPFAGEKNNTPVDLWVRVIDERGAPVSGARVAGLWEGTPHRETGKSGEVLFRGVTERAINLRISHPSRGELQISQVTEERTVIKLVAQYPRGCRLYVNTGGRAEVTLIGTGKDAVRRQMKTDARGDVVFFSLPPGEYVIFADGRPTRALHDMKIELADGDAEVRMSLSESITLPGRLLFAPGVEKDGWLISATPANLHPSIGVPATSTITRAKDDGRFQLRSLSEGTYLITARREKPTDLLLDGGVTSVRLIIRPGMPELELRAGGAALVEGTVHYEGAHPPPALTASLKGDGLTLINARTDAARGTFVALVPELGWYDVIIRAPGFRPVAFELEITGDRPLHPKIAMLRAEGVRGAIVDPDGAAIAGALITPIMPDFPGGHEGTSSDSEGRFELSEVDIEDRVRLRIDARGRAPLIIDVTSATPRIALLHGGPVIGRVSFDEGRPGKSRMIWRSVTAPAGSAPIAELELGPSGGYRLADLPLGMLQVELTPEATEQTWVRIVPRRELFTSLMLSAKKFDTKLRIKVPKEIRTTGDLRLTLVFAGAADRGSNGMKFFSSVPVPASGDLFVTDLWPGRYHVVLEWVGPSSIEPLTARTVTISASGPAPEILLQP